MTKLEKEMKISRLLTKIKIKAIRHMRGMGWLKEPPRSYLYNGRRYPYYQPPNYATSDGRLYFKEEEFFKSVKFIKTIDRLRKII